MSTKICPNFIPASGKAKVAFVGEAPGEDEETLGEPFVGRAGRELNRWLVSAGISRQNSFLGNLAQKRPPKNELKAFFMDSKCTVPGPILQEGMAELQADLITVNPNVVVALGNHAIHALTGRTDPKGGTALTKFWGSILPCTLVPGLKVVCMPHPSWLIRGMFAFRPVINVFMDRIVTESKSQEISLPQRDYVINPSLEEVMYHLERLQSVPRFAYDIEDPGGEIVCISFADSPNWAISIPFTVGRDHRWHAEIEAEIWKKIAKLLGGDALKIAHNMRYDVTKLARANVIVKPPRFCTQIGHHITYPDLSRKEFKPYKLNALAFCTALYTREPFYKDDHKSADEPEAEMTRAYRNRREEFWLYNAKDSAVCFEVFQCEEEDHKELGITEYARYHMELFEALETMSLTGFLRDQERLEKLSSRLNTEMATAKAKLSSLLGEDFNPRSSPQTAELLYTKLGLPVQYDKDTGKVTTDEAAICQLKTKCDNPILSDIIIVRRLGKFDGTYVRAPLLNGRFHCDYNQYATTTFRLGSNKFTIDQVGGNLQNQPVRLRPNDPIYNEMVKEYRRTFIPDPGYILWARDLKQAEAMIVAWLAEDEKQIADFLSGVDIHCRSAEILFEEPYDFIRSEYKNGNPDYKIKRQFGKTVRHAFNYRVGKRELRKRFLLDDFDVPEYQCGHYLDAMRYGNPKIINWQNEVEDHVRSKRVIVTLMGARRFFMGILDDKAIREAIAFEPQSTVADITNTSIKRTQKEMGTVLDLLLNVHDAIVGQSPEELVYDHVAQVGELMKVPLVIKGRPLTIPSDCKIGPNWGDMQELEN